jgi:nicotinate phosphoribosyltransferase
MTISHRVGPLFTDLYELTMGAGYFARRMMSTATFSLFIRGNSLQRKYYVAAGLEDALQEMETSRFSAEDIAYLKASGLFNDDFLDYLKSFRFTGNVIALPEGTIFFAGEPILEITAPLIEVQIFETYLLNSIGFQTLIASKAARCIYAARGRPLIDFSMRRTQGHDAALKVARSTYITGFAATSNVLGGQVYGIPISGTMAHSFVQAFGSDYEAFKAFAEIFPHNSVFLIDTYNTLEGARQAVRVAKEMKVKGRIPLGVRLDSGDMVHFSRQVRKILDDADLQDIKIYASSGFDEFKIADTLTKGAKIDAFGVGTNLGVSADAPFVDIIYKMVRYQGRDVRKFSPGKITLAGEKQVYRAVDESGVYQQDYIGLRNETVEGSLPMMESVMQDGKIVRPFPSLQAIRDRFNDCFSGLPEKYKVLDAAESYPVKLTPGLEMLQK